jgi:myo-inositol-1(or 4)-monophosphatase
MTHWYWTGTRAGYVRSSGWSAQCGPLGRRLWRLAYVACGRLDAFFEADMSPWDTLAGTLLVEEAGGLVTTFAGVHRPMDHRADILATNGPLHGDILARLTSHI